MIFTILHAIVLWILQFYPYPELFIYPYLTNIGFLPYKQILDQHFPGLIFFPINFFSLGFRDPSSFHMLLILIVIINSVWIYRISKSQLAVFFYMLWQPFFEGNQLWLDQFLPLFTLPSYWFFVRNSFLISGLLLGLGVVFKQTLIPLVAFAGVILLFRRQFKNLLIFGLACTLPSTAMLVYFYSKGILQDFWYWTVQFNLSTYAAGGKLAPTLNELIKISLPLGLILVSLYVLRKNNKSFLIMSFLIFSIIGGVARFGLIHLQPAIPFFCLLLSLSSSKISKSVRVVLVIPMIVLLGWFYLRQTNLGITRFFEPEILNIVSEIKNMSIKGDKIFLLGLYPHIYQLTGTIPAGNIFVFQFPWFLKIAGLQILENIKKDPPKLVVYDSSSQIDGLILRNYADYLVRYIEENYIPIKNIGTITFYESRN